MGLIQAIKDSVGGVMADQWREYFYCEAMPEDVLVRKGIKRATGRSSNTKGSDNVITNGSVVVVADGQCALIVDQGKVVEVCAVPDSYVYDASSEPTLLYGSLSDSIPGVFKAMLERFTFGGEIPKDQRIYYINIRELGGKKYGTPNPVPFRVVDRNIGLDVDISISCFGEYSIRITNPVLFYANVCGNVSGDFQWSRIESQLKAEVLTALQPAFGKISAMGIRYSELPGHTMEMAAVMNEVLSQQWAKHRGVEIISFAVASVKASKEDEDMIKELQRNAVFRNPNMAAAHLVNAQAEAMQSAAKNESGAMMGFMGMGMAQTAGGVNAQSLFQMGAAAPQQPQAAAPGAWVCPGCGKQAHGKFCGECGTKRPEVTPEGWVCTCGAVNQGKFCPECGTKKPAGVPQFRCDKCGWKPEDPKNPPKFCPECGDRFDAADQV